MNLIEREGVRFFVSEHFADPALTHGFSTRSGGVSTGPYESLNLWYESGDPPANVGANRRRLAAALGIAPAEPITALQVHGAEVLEVRAPSPRPPPVADALVTNRPGLFIAVGMADCVPILLWDPEQRAVGAVHTGWKGTHLGIVRRAVETLTRLYGSRPERLLAAIGPSAGPCCYEVGPDVAGLFPPELLLHSSDGRTRLDLWASNRRQLLEAGLRAENIEDAELCTICRPDLFYSYRRDRRLTGGMLAVIGMRSARC